MKKVTVSVISFLMVFMFFMSIDAQQRMGREGFYAMKHARMGIKMAEKNLFPPRMLLKFKDEIGLSADQVSKIEKIRDSFQERAIKGKADIKILEMKLDNYFAKDQINRTKLISMVKEISRKKTDMHIGLINHLLDVKEILTKDQIDKIDAIKKERMKERMKNRSGKCRSGQRSRRRN